MLTPNVSPIPKTAALAAVATILALASVAACTPGFDPSPTVVETIHGAWNSPTPGPSPTPVPDPDVEAGALIRFTHTDASEANPTWAPDGDKIAFECHDDAWLRKYLENSHVPGNRRQVRNWKISFAIPESRICVVNSDGTGRFQLTDDNGDDSAPAWSPDGDTLAFASDRDGSEGIFLINSDGSQLERITRDGSIEEGPVWSPDGTKIAFTSNSDGYNDDIFVIHPDGTGLMRITDDSLTEKGLAWSPDGSQLAFASAYYSRRSGREEAGHIYVINPDGSNLRQVTDHAGFHSAPTWSPDSSRIAFIAGGPYFRGLTVVNPDGTKRDLHYQTVQDMESPAWSPDGSRIVFAALPWNSRPSHGLELYMINADGSGLRRLTTRAGADSNPTWSPDGSKLAFESRLRLPHRGGFYNPEIYLMVDFDPDLLMITDFANSDRIPEWSPDGTQIAYVSERDGDYEIYVSDADGSSVEQLTANDSRESRPSWSPDGTRLAYVSDYDGDEDIYTINADGSGIKRLTDNDHPDSRPVWSPDGSKIAYVSLHNGRHTDIFVMNADGSGIIQLTAYDDLETRHYNGAPSWSPDGTRIAFISVVHGQFKRHVVNSDGTQRVTARARGCVSYVPASWSRDSTSIAFECGNSQIHVMNPSDGTETFFRVCGWGPPASSPSWSADGTHINFNCSDYWIRRINLVDRAMTRYETQGCGINYRAWSPDEGMIAHMVYRDGAYDLCVAEPVLAQQREFTPP